jgi:hypothetical protein
VQVYFYQTFPLQLRLLAVRPPNQVIRQDIMRDPNAVFFGGPDWENAAADLHTIPEQDRCRFILSLFLVVLTDQALYTYFRDSYEKWRKATSYPKFGWAGFGAHNENPFKILWAPERDRLINVDELLAVIPEFASFLVEETRTYFAEHLPEVNVRDYFANIRNDRGYASFDEGLIVPRFKAEFAARTGE